MSNLWGWGWRSATRGRRRRSPRRRRASRWRCRRRRRRRGTGRRNFSVWRFRVCSASTWSKNSIGVFTTLLTQLMGLNWLHLELNLKQSVQNNHPQLLKGLCLLFLYNCSCKAWLSARSLFAVPLHSKNETSMPILVPSLYIQPTDSWFFMINGHVNHASGLRNMS